MSQTIQPSGQERRCPLLTQAVHAALARRPRPASARWSVGVALGSMAALAAADPSPLAQLELSSLLPNHGGDGSAGFVMSGADRYDYTGASVSTAGDVNADGIDDLIIGAPQIVLSSPGDAYILFGRLSPFNAQLPLSSLLAANGGDGSEGFVLHGVPRGSSGFSVRTAGDVNGDGVEDVVIGAPSVSRNGRYGNGEAYVVFGRAAGFPAEINLASLLAASGGDGSAGFVLEGVPYNSGYAGWAVSGGDINGDGRDDVVLTAINAASFRGQAYVVFGRATDFPPEIRLSDLLVANGGDGSQGFVCTYVDPGVMGKALGTGDVNGDGLDDVFISQSTFDGSNEVGRAYVLFGRKTAFPPEFDLGDLLARHGGDGSSGVVLTNLDEDEYCCDALGNAGDVNGDGIEDVLVGAPFAGEPNTGRVYVVFGRSAAFPAELALVDLLAGNGGDGSTGFVIHGIDSAGGAVSGAGDVSGDGIDDVIIGAPSADPHGFGSGEAYVVFGRDGGFPAEIDVADLFADQGGDGSAGFVLEGIAEGDSAGEAVSGAGDLDGDGIDDVVVGAERSEAGGDAYSIGEAYVVFARPPLDVDRDGAENDTDNCLAHANEDQRDTDADDIGNRCDPDLNNDCVVNFPDLGRLKQVFFSSDPDADFNGDGFVNFLDLGVMKGMFFQPPGPSGLANLCDGG